MPAGRDSHSMQRRFKRSDWPMLHVFVVYSWRGASANSAKLVSCHHLVLSFSTAQRAQDTPPPLASFPRSSSSTINRRAPFTALGAASADRGKRHVKLAFGNGRTHYSSRLRVQEGLVHRKEETLSILVHYVVLHCSDCRWLGCEEKRVGPDLTCST